MQVDLRALKGNWDAGFALHKHVLTSAYTGDNEYGHPTFDTTRSDPGEALFQLKYRGDFGQVEPLAEAINQHIVPRLGKFGLIVPMPATKVRKRQPVNEVAAKLSQLTGKPLFDDLLVKRAEGAGSEELKNLTTKEEKAGALSTRFQINPSIENEGRWNALLVDDLFDTGASMEAACAALRTYEKIGDIFVAAISWK